MKNQLLEDFGDSRSQPVAPVVKPQQRAGEAAVSGATAPSVAAPSGPRVWRARAPSPRPVWRARAPQGPMEPASGVGAPEAEPAATFIETPRPAPIAPAPDSHAGTFASTFASERPDPALRLAAVPARGGMRRRVLFGWAAVALIGAGAVGAGSWLVRDSQVASALALVARQADPVPAPAPYIAPYIAPAPAPPPPLVLVPATPASAVAIEEPDDARKAGPRQGAQAGDAGEAAVAPGFAPPGQAAATKPRPASPRPRPAPKAEERKPAARAVAQAAPRPRKETARSAPVGKAAPGAPEPQLSHAETLRLCRAAGYHASQCMRRGCVATKFGLACRG